MIVTLSALAVLIVVLGLVLRVVVASSARRTITSPRKLFRSLCQAHRLTWSDRCLLRKLARCRGLADASRLFVDPPCFDKTSLRGALHAHADRISELRRRLFGS